MIVDLLWDCCWICCLTQAGIVPTVFTAPHLFTSPCTPTHPPDCHRQSTSAHPAQPQQERPQYLYHFVLHAALDAVEEQEWHSSAMHLGVVDRFNNLQVVGGWGMGWVEQGVQLGCAGIRHM